MSTNPIERAYELARSGRSSSLTDLIRALRDERFDDVEAHIGGRGTRRELSKLMAAARGHGADRQRAAGEEAI